MSLWIHVGQAGIQIGHQFWKLINESCESKNTNGLNKCEATSQQFFLRGGKARSILVDTEPKVVREINEWKPNFFRNENQFTEQSGRGNNWGYGYFDAPNSKNRSPSEKPIWSNNFNSEHEDKILEKVMTSVRKEIEACGFFGGCVMVHSLAGGTGSGLGSHILELLRDEYPSSFILSAVVAPYFGGETPLQGYNASLSISWLQKFSDGIILFQNDQLNENLSIALSKSNSQKLDGRGRHQVSVTDVNMYIASCLTSVFLPYTIPSYIANDNTTQCIPFDFGDFVTNVCPDPRTKFVEVSTWPFVKSVKQSKNDHVSWIELTNHLMTMAARYNKNKVILSSMSQMIVRGDTDHFFASEMEHVRTKLMKQQAHVSWNPFPVDFKISTTPALPSRNVLKSLTLCSNRNSVTDCIHGLLESAQVKFAAKAYLHWYLRYGCEEGMFEEAFETISQILDGYQDLC